MCCLVATRTWMPVSAITLLLMSCTSLSQELEITSGIDAPGIAFQPVSYEDVYGADPLGLHPTTRMMQAAITDEGSAERLRAEIAAYGGAYELKRIDGHYVVVSTGKPPEGLAAHDNHLDMPLSFAVKDVTVWEALKQLNLKVADVANREVPLRTTVEFGSPKKPDAVWSIPCVTIDATDVPVRNILLEILGQAEIPLAYLYKYREGPIKGRAFSYGQLSVFAYNKWGDLAVIETKEGLLIPDSTNHSYRGKTHEPFFDGVLSAWVDGQFKEANKAFEAAMSRLENLPELPKEQR